MLTECPFAERILREQLEARGLTVIPVFIVELASVVQTRYLAQRGRELPKASATRATSIVNRADEWGAVRGTSQQVLDYLREVET
jgi:hypothetical protein